MAPITLSYDQVDNASKTILTALSAGNFSVGYGMLGCAMTVARLHNQGRKLTDDEEIKFIEAIMPWIEAYWSKGPSAGMN